MRDRTIQVTARKGMGHAQELAQTVLYTVQKGYAFYRGVTDWDGEDGDENWLVYISNPPWAFDYKTGERVKAWKGEVFLVFVDEDMVIRRWRWDDADEKNPRLPIGHDQGRFVEKLL